MHQSIESLLGGGGGGWGETENGEAVWAYYAGIALKDIAPSMLTVANIAW